MLKVAVTCLGVTQHAFTHRVPCEQKRRNTEVYLCKQPGLVMVALRSQGAHMLQAQCALLLMQRRAVCYANLQAAASCSGPPQ